MPLQSTSGAATYDAFGVSAVSAVTQAEAIDFDGTNDVLSRANLTGNISSKTFTFSAFFYRTSATNTFVYNVNNSSLSQFFFVSFDANGVFSITGRNSGGTNILVVSASGGAAPLNTWISVLMSVDLANTSNRQIAINDRLVTGTWSTYSNQLIAFPQTTHTVGAYSTTFGRQRLSNVFLDYTYRNLSVEANRRLFVTANLNPAAGQAALNPIMYLPMSNPTAPGTNAGTGGDFALTGVVARSGRGPNQYNAPYSTFDGVDDKLSRSNTPSGLVDGKQFTFQCVFNPNNIASNNTIISFSTIGNQRFAIWHNNDGQLSLFGRNSSGTTILNATVTNPTFVIGRNYVVTVSLDLANSAARHIYINGVAATSVTWSTYTNANIDFAFTDEASYDIGCANGTVNFFNGRLGALWFNTSYIDLSVAANLAKFVTGTGINAAPVDPGGTGQLPTGVSPIIYLPMYSNSASRNSGTGGDFPAFGGNFVGARGPNEFWGNWAFTSQSNSKILTRAASVFSSESKTFTLNFWIRRGEQDVGTDYIFDIDGAFEVRLNPSNKLDIQSSSNLQYNSNTSIEANTTYHVLVSVDLTNTAKRHVYINGVLDAGSWFYYVNTPLSIDRSPIALFSDHDGFSTMRGQLGEFYLANSYLDIGQEANRLKFRDCFGNPVDLSAQITAAAIPTPAVYMRFPPTAFGTNSGTGGAFTVNTSPQDRGQF